jgi:hypothetical protein
MVAGGSHRISIYYLEKSRAPSVHWRTSVARAHGAAAPSPPLPDLGMEATDDAATAGCHGGGLDGAAPRLWGSGMSV